jgi:hypothetical protein
MALSKQRVEIVTGETVVRPYGPVHKKYKARNLLVLKHTECPIRFSTSSRNEKYIYDTFVQGISGGNFFCFCNPELDELCTNLEDGYLAEYRYSYYRQEGAVIACQTPFEKNRFRKDSMTMREHMKLGILTTAIRLQRLEWGGIEEFVNNWVKVEKIPLSIRNSRGQSFLACENPQHTWTTRAREPA